MDNAYDDIPDSPHKNFIKQYLKDWPYPHLTQYKVGQSFNAELGGVQQKCEVQIVDSSLIHVVFQVSVVQRCYFMLVFSCLFVQHLLTMFFSYSA